MTKACKAPEPRPCPFCKNDGSKSRLNVCEAETRHAGWDFIVECTNCGANGPCASSEESAATLWNNGAQAELKAAVAACLWRAEELANVHSGWAADEIANYIEETQKDAQAALEAVKREARNEGRMEAADAARSWYHNLGKGTPHDEILALMEVTGDDT